MTRTRRKPRFETWNNRDVTVTRNSRGRFLTWHFTARRQAPQATVTTTTGRTRQVRRGYTYSRVSRPQRIRQRKERQTEQRRKQREKKRFTGKHIVVYSTKDGQSRRWNLFGTRNQLHDAISGVAYYHPPRKRFCNIQAEDLIDDPEDNIEGYWDEKPTVEPQY